VYVCCLFLWFVDEKSRPASGGAVHNVLPGFTKAAAPSAERKHYPPPQLPRDYRPFHEFESALSSALQTDLARGTDDKKKLDAHSRGAVLGEVPHLSMWLL